MNSMNDSGDCQDVESNCGGKLSHVSSQAALLSRDKRFSLDTWNQSGLQENVFGIEFSPFDSPRDCSHRTQSDDVRRNREAVPEAGRTKTSHTSEDRSFDDSEFSFIAQPRETLLTHVYIWITGERFLDIKFLRLIHLEIFLKEFHLTTCKEIEKQTQ